MKRTRLLLLFPVLGAAALLAPAAQAGSRCSDDVERCVKSTATLSRPVNRVVSGATSAPLMAPLPVIAPGSPATAPPVLARKATAPAKKLAGKLPRNAPAPTPGMGMLLRLSTGGGDISFLQGRSGESTAGQSWVL